MADHPNAAKVREIADETERTGDMSKAFDNVDDDIVWHEIGRDEPIRGKQALMERMTGMPEGATIATETHDVIADAASSQRLLGFDTSSDLDGASASPMSEARALR